MEGFTDEGLLLLSKDIDGWRLIAQWFNKQGKYLWNYKGGE